MGFRFDISTLRASAWHVHLSDDGLRAFLDMHVLDARWRLRSRVSVSWFMELTGSFRQTPDRLARSVAKAEWQVLRRVLRQVPTRSGWRWRDRA